MADADPLQEARRQLEQDGYTVLHDAVPLEAISVVVRRLNMAIRRHGLSPQEIDAWQTTGFFPHLRWEPEVWGVLPADAPDLLGWQEGDQWGEPQLLLRFPEEEQEREPEPQVDELPPWAAGRFYRGTVGVALTTADAAEGIAWVWPGSHRGEQGEPTQVPLGVGDALVMHPELGHAATLNLGDSVRMAVYFRLVAGAVA